jgi:hypothetical protein
MDAQLGYLGFWLFLGMIIAASIVSGALKEREKERDKQALLRGLLEKDGKSATEILAYLREKDAAEAAVAAAMSARFRTRLRRLPALAVGMLAFYVGIAIGLSGTVWTDVLPDSVQPIPLVMMVGIWAVGLTVAVRLWRWAKQKDDAHRAA